MSTSGVRLNYDECMELLQQVNILDLKVKAEILENEKRKQIRKDRAKDFSMYMDTENDSHPLKRFKNEICALLSE